MINGIALNKLTMNDTIVEKILAANELLFADKRVIPNISPRQMQKRRNNSHI